MGWVLMGFFFIVILHVKLLTSQSKPCDLQSSLQSPQAYLDIFGAIFDNNDKFCQTFSRMCLRVSRQTDWGMHLLMPCLMVALFEMRGVFLECIYFS